MRKEEIERRKNKKRRKRNQNTKERGGECQERRYVLKEDKREKRRPKEREREREEKRIITRDPEKGTKERETSEKTVRFRKKLPPL